MTGILEGDTRSLDNGACRGFHLGALDVPFTVSLEEVAKCSDKASGLVFRLFFIGPKP